MFDGFFGEATNIFVKPFCFTLFKNGDPLFAFAYDLSFCHNGYCTDFVGLVDILFGVVINLENLGRLRLLMAGILCGVRDESVVSLRRL